MKLKVVVIGSGKLAYQLFPALQKTGLVDFIQVISPRHHTASDLAIKLNCEVICSLDGINEKADLVFLATPDSEIGNVSNELKNYNGTLVHCSGSMSLDEIQHDKRAVFYPLQTFTKDKKVDFEQVPICIESNSESLTESLENLANGISQKVYKIDSEQRKYIHIAAVYACNFSNLMYQYSENILNSKGIDSSILHNLINETAGKLKYMSAKEAQTGPAIRRDTKSLDTHKQILTEFPENYNEVYELLTAQIQKLNG